VRKPASYDPAEGPAPAGLTLKGCCFCGADLVAIKILPPLNNHYKGIPLTEANHPGPFFFLTLIPDISSGKQRRTKGCKLLAIVFKEIKRYYSEGCSK
jgi:hypothetical protein